MLVEPIVIARRRRAIIFSLWCLFTYLFALNMATLCLILVIRSSFITSFVRSSLLFLREKFPRLLGLFFVLAPLRCGVGLGGNTVIRRGHLLILVVSLAKESCVVSPNLAKNRRIFSTIEIIQR